MVRDPRGQPGLTRGRGHDVRGRLRDWPRGRHVGSPRAARQLTGGAAPAQPPTPLQRIAATKDRCCRAPHCPATTAPTRNGTGGPVPVRSAAATAWKPNDDRETPTPTAASRRSSAICTSPPGPDSLLDDPRRVLGLRALCEVPTRGVTGRSTAIWQVFTTLKRFVCRRFASRAAGPRLPENRGVPGSSPGLATPGSSLAHHPRTSKRLTSSAIEM
jgi:hypothetical protein